MSNSDSRLHSGRVLCGKWRLDSMLGEGGMATVWSGEHRNGLKVAIKVLKAELGADATLRERFLREGYVANRIEHPGVLRVLDDDVSDDGVVFLVMDLLKGETLRDHWLERERILSPNTVRKIAIQILEVLAVAHTMGIVHRDLKPDNVFLLDDGGIKLLDFGIARLREVSGIDQKTRTGAMLGTPAFMPPEQAL
ncbi:MAG TPA: serine/threonine-protein kinase, partial [Polyangiaceae bacterium]|nr:serine/threonine-protein kinase [Polyangiaceae bacterium]